MCRSRRRRTGRRADRAVGAAHARGSIRPGVLAREVRCFMADSKAEPIRHLNPPELGTPPGYSQIVEVRAGRIIFIAGQTALDGSGKLVGKGDFAAQAAQVFRNLAIALQSVGCTASNLV